MALRVHALALEHLDFPLGSPALSLISASFEHLPSTRPWAASGDTLERGEQNPFVEKFLWPPCGVQVGRRRDW